MNGVAKSSVVVLMLASCAMAQPGEGAAFDQRDVGVLLDQKIDQLTLSGKRVSDALVELGRRVGVEVSVDDMSIDLLPWGSETKLADLTVRDASMREVLSQILDPLGLMYQLEDGGVRVVATEPLKRINRRSTWNDLKLLQRCNTTPYSPESFATFNLQYRITSKVDAPKMLEHQLTRAGRGTVAQMLEVATASLGWVWFPNEDHIAIRTSQAQIANKLSRRVTCRYINRPLSQILVDLADRAEVPLNLQPGMMLKLPPTTAQSYTLVLQRSSIRQALESISAETGLEYEMRRDGLYIELATEFGEGGNSAGGVRSLDRSRNSPYVGRISVPSADGSYTFDLILRADEVPADILELREQILDEVIQKMRRDMAPVGEPERTSEEGEAESN